MGRTGNLVGFSRMRPDNRLPSRARTWTATVAAPHADADTIDTLRLLTSEVATNAVEHGHATGIVRVTVLITAEQRVRVEVFNENPPADGDEHRCPTPRAASDDDEDGRGLLLLDALAHSWGHGPGPDGKGTTVWFEIDAKASA
ncbi:anti-sigma regulatory factor (Ser/Thr protein kinase) [Actinocorallia herbida]|uniref:Anti-sigma regulatory factor (Ser/Thr protein kinase) n=1 Tax=Actinocorallia herbida TaxID=58109 RepID=A0A3N1DB75_9ACTN|nr:ATP-binding protein [Actinocorallia herbida]ROO90770.1 anti-sigma regulatory factor (Ser/Thr protein kinase) [Actinocorallia herbida]